VITSTGRSASGGTSVDVAIRSRPGEEAPGRNQPRRSEHEKLQYEESEDDRTGQNFLGHCEPQLTVEGQHGTVAATGLGLLGHTAHLWWISRAPPPIAPQGLVTHFMTLQQVLTCSDL
jgi:hypothetical protein